MADNNTGNSKDASEYIQKAFDAKERTSEREKFYISSHYYGMLRRQEDKDVEALEQWVQAYPRDNVPRDNLALAEAGIGQHEKALASASEAMRLDPKDPYAYQNLAVDYLSLNRYDEAKAVAEQAIAQKAEPWSIHITLYGLAFLRGDEAAMRHEVERATGKMEETNILLLQARGECALGEIKKARESYAHAASAAQARGSKERGASVLAAEAGCDAEAGFPQEARQTMNAALALSENINSRAAATVLFARIGDAAQSGKLTEELSKEFPYATLLNQVQLPTARAMISLQRSQPAEAVAALDSARPYEFGAGGITAMSVRGEAFVRLHDGKKAAAEYQRILDHRGLDPTGWLYSLAHLGLGRAYALQGDTGKAKAAYRDFFAVWKDADEDVPVLKTAKAEYEKLR